MMVPLTHLRQFVVLLVRPAILRFFGRWQMIRLPRWQWPVVRKFGSPLISEGYCWMSFWRCAEMGMIRVAL